MNNPSLHRVGTTVAGLLLSSFISVVWLGGVVAGMTADAADPPEMAFLPEVVIIGKRPSPQHEGQPTLSETTSLPTDTVAQATTRPGLQSESAIQ